MATLNINSQDTELFQIYKYLNGESQFQNLIVNQDASETLLKLEDGSEIKGKNLIILGLSFNLNDKFKSSDEALQTDVQQWLTKTLVSSTELETLAKEVNTFLSGKSFLASNQFSVCDVVAYLRLYPYISSSTVEVQKTQLNVMRWINQVQQKLNAIPALKEDSLPQLVLDMEALGLAKKKKEKKPQPAAAPKEALKMIPSLLDLRVGVITSVKKHEEADSLYVEQIEMGEAEPRTVVSGLVNHFSLEQMQGRKLIVVCNLKPVSMRGVKSYAMVLCGTSAEGKVEFVNPPADALPGTKVEFKGFEGNLPEPLLNPKKKIWETLQPGLLTDDNCLAGWKDAESGTFHLLQVNGESCRTESAANAPLK